MAGLASRLEVEANFRGEAARCYVMRAGESGEEVVERDFVGDIYGGQPQAHLVALRAEEVIVADGEIKEMARCDALRVFVVVLSTGSGNAD